MLKPLLALCLLTAQAGEIYSTVKKESAALLSCITKEKCGDSSVYLDIPWNEPSFQFWRSYYRNRWNRLKLFSYVDNFKLFYPTVKKIFKEEGLPEDLALLAVVESNGNPDAVSKAGAAGLWQLMPATARKYGLKVNRYIDERFDLEKSTRAAARYLKYLYSLFNRWDLAIAAYNAGPGRIENRLKKLGADEFWDLTKLPDETLNYVPKFYAVLNVIKKSGLLKKEPSENLIKVKVVSRTYLRRISKKLSISYPLLKRFNRTFKRGIVPAGYYVYVPSKHFKRKDFLKYVSSSKVYIYVPRRAERVSYIAKKFGVEPKLIKELNSLRRGVVYRGQTLLIVKLSKERKNDQG